MTADLENGYDICDLETGNLVASLPGEALALALPRPPALVYHAACAQTAPLMELSAVVVRPMDTRKPGATLRFFRLVPSPQVTREDSASNADKYVQELFVGRKPRRRKPDDAESLHM